MIIKLPIDSIEQASLDEVKAFEASGEGQKALTRWLDDTDFKDRWSVRRNDLSDKETIALVFAEAYVLMEKGYLLIEDGHGCVCVWDPESASWVYAGEFKPFQ